MEREIMREGRIGKTEEAGKEWELAPTDFSLRAKPHPRSMLWAPDLLQSCASHRIHWARLHAFSSVLGIKVRDSSVFSLRSLI